MCTYIIVLVKLHVHVSLNYHQKSSKFGYLYYTSFSYKKSFEKENSYTKTNNSCAIVKNSFHFKPFLPQIITMKHDKFSQFHMVSFFVCVFFKNDDKKHKNYIFSWIFYNRCF